MFCCLKWCMDADFRYILRKLVIFVNYLPGNVSECPAPRKKIRIAPSMWKRLLPEKSGPAQGNARFFAVLSQAHHPSGRSECLYVACRPTARAWFCGCCGGGIQSNDPYQGLENLQKSRRMVVASNHPLGGLMASCWCRPSAGCEKIFSFRWTIFCCIWPIYSPFLCPSTSMEAMLTTSASWMTLFVVMPWSVISRLAWFRENGKGLSATSTGRKPSFLKPGNLRGTLFQPISMGKTLPFLQSVQSAQSCRHQG